MDRWDEALTREWINKNIEGGSMGYYEPPEHCRKCGIETQREDGLCTPCWKERKAEYDAEQSERA